MRANAKAGWVLAACVGGLLLAGCGSRGVPEPSGAATVSARACPAAADAMPQGLTSWGPERLGADVRVSAVVECVVENRVVAGDGQWAFVIEKRATADLGPLLIALLAEDEPIPWSQGCAANMELLPWFAVVTDDGTWLRPRIPVTSCGQPEPAVFAALQELRWTTVSTTRSQQLRSQKALKTEARAAAAGCPNGFKDMLAVEAADRTPATGPITLGSPTGAVSVCHFVAGRDSDGSPAQTLSFTSGRHVPAATAARLAAAAAASGPVAACTKPHTRVAEVQAATGGWLLVELDGCHRVLDGDTHGWGQATPALLAAIAASS
jgi:hypothetical protein